MKDSFLVFMLLNVGSWMDQAPVLSMMMMMMAVVIEDTRIGNGIIVTSDDGNRQTYLVSVN